MYVWRMYIQLLCTTFQPTSLLPSTYLAITNLFLGRGPIYIFWSMYCFVGGFLLLRHTCTVIQTFKVHIFWEGTKFCEIFPLLLTTVHQSKVRGRFRKILWPSQNIWTLCMYRGPSFHLASSKLKIRISSRNSVSLVTPPRTAASQSLICTAQWPSQWGQIFSELEFEILLPYWLQRIDKI